MNSSKEHNIAKQYVNDFFPACIGAILFGSYAENLNSPNSDIDILVIDNMQNAPLQYKVSYQNYIIEIFILPINSISNSLLNDFNSQNNVLLSILTSGIVIKDNSKLYARTLVEFTKAVLKQYYPINEREIVDIRFKLANYIEDVEYNELDVIQKFILIEKIIDYIMILNLHGSNSLFGWGKHRVKYFKKFNQSLHVELVNALEEFMANKNATGLISISKRELDRFGGKPNDRISENTLNIGERVLISIKKATDVSLFLDRFITHLRFLNISIDYCYFKDNSFICELTCKASINYTYIRKSIFLFFNLPIISKKIEVHMKLIPLLYGSVKVNELAHMQLKDFFFHVYNSSHFYSIIYNESIKYIVGIYIVGRIMCTLDFDRYQVTQFSLFALENWLPNAYGFSDRIFSHETLIEKKKQVITNISQKCADNIELITDIISGELIHASTVTYLDILNVFSQYFVQSYSNFKEKYRHLCQENSLNFPRFEIARINVENIQLAEEIYLNYIIIDKIFEMLNIKNKHEIAYVFSKI